MVKRIPFRITGAAITGIAREKLYIDHDLNKALDILVNNLECDELTYNDRVILALQILNYDADIVGIYPPLDDEEKAELLNDPDIDEETKSERLTDLDVKFKDGIDVDKINLSNIIEHLTKPYQELIEVKKELSELTNKFLFLCDNIPSYKLDGLNCDYYELNGERLFKSNSINNENFASGSMPNALVTSFLKQRQRANECDTSEDYGWLAPDGTYYPVEWGEHQKWANTYMEEHYPYRDKSNKHAYHKTDNNGEEKLYLSGDALMYCLHWVLLDSPCQGLANHHYDASYGLTKKQKEFLYDYYIQRGRNDEANALYKEG